VSREIGAPMQIFEEKAKVKMTPAVRRVILPPPHVCRRGHPGARIIESRPVAGYIRRRLSCPVCGLRWSTYETIIHPRRLVVRDPSSTDGGR
jgi:hypothetical protein